MLGKALLILAVLTVCTAWNPWTNRIGSRTFSASKKSASSRTGNGATSVKNDFLQQLIDHTSGSDTFSQRYAYTEKFAAGKKVAFLLVSGQEELDPTLLEDETYPFVKFARKYGATLFSLEHRFYGQSQPFDTLSIDNMRTLTSAQAVADVAEFIKFANKQHILDDGVRWVLFGANIGGFVAAQARAQFPGLVTGVIGSSVPLKLKMDFWEYNDQVEQSISTVGGNACAKNIKDAFTVLAISMTTPEGRANISTTFNLTNPLEKTSLGYNDIQLVYAAAVQPFQVIAQFNNELGLNIFTMCNIMQNKTNTPLQNLANVNKLLQDPNVPFQIANDYNANVKALKVEPIANNYFAEARAWTWQSCNEFGTFPSTNNGENSMFGAGVPSNFFLNECYDIFGANFTAVYIRDQVSSFNAFFGGADGYTGTNAVFTNGDLDPLSRLGKTYTTDFSVVVYLLIGCSHAQDMFPQSDVNNLYINNAHEIMSENIYNWINGPINPVTHVNNTNIWTRPDTYSGLSRVERPTNRFSPLSEDVPSKKTYPAWKAKNRKFILGRPPHGFLPEPDMDNRKDNTYPPGFEVGTFRQRVNHFDNTNPKVFQQKYFKNAQWAKPGGPNFLMIGGEGPESERWVLNENITYLTWAKKYGATVYLLEHRYYGDSTIGDNQNLRYLSSLQMLYDLADFIREVNAQTNNPAPWITFGGSYSGAMSAWMREVFPDLVIGAVGSSGPVFAKLDFYEYLVVVENSIRRYNNTCAENIKSAFDTMQNLFLTKEGRTYLSTTFTLVPAFGEVVTQTDQHYFFSNIYGNFQGAVQYSGDNTGSYANGYGIPDMCKIMLNDTNTPIQNVAQFNRFMTEFYQGGDPFISTDNEYQFMIDDLKNAQKYGPASAASLLWTYQTCTEFGYFQSTDYGYGIFGSPTPVNMFNQMCTDVFDGFDAVSIQSSIDSTNWKYGSRDNYKGTNVVLPNGNVDPWHALGLYNAPDASVVPYLIDGTAHCADMYPARDSDVPGLKVVRDLIDANIAKWLAKAPASTTVASTVIPPDATTKDASLISKFLVLIIAFYTIM